MLLFYRTIYCCYPLLTVNDFDLKHQTFLMYLMTLNNVKGSLVVKNPQRIIMQLFHLLSALSTMLAPLADVLK